MPFISYAQNMEDVLLWRALQHVDAGFYIDVGAADPIIESVTMAFYERGWHGINIDPVPEHIVALHAARPRDINLELAITHQAGQDRLYQFPGTGWSTLDKRVANGHKSRQHQPTEREVQTETLAAICHRHVTGEIHFLKVDVEGLEAQVIASGDYQRFRPWIIVVEATVPATAEPAPRTWETTLDAAGYRFAQFDGLNCYYVAEEHAAAVLPAMITPVNVFDDYLPIQHLITQNALVDAERRNSVNEQRAAEAMAMARESEMSLLAQAAQIQLLHAEAEQALAQRPRIQLPSQQLASDAEVVRTPAQRLFVDATLMLRHGFLSAVGLLRVEHYVTEYLMRAPDLDVDFVVFDSGRGAYQSVTEEQRAILEQVLFFGPKQQAPSQTERLSAGQAGENTPAVSKPSEFRRRLTTAATLTRAEFEVELDRIARRHLPVELKHTMVRRVGTRVLRRLGLAAARQGYRAAVVAATLRRKASHALRHVAAPDSDLFIPTKGSDSGLNGMTKNAVDSGSHDDSPFQPGDVLLCMSNLWDYMDYRYLARLSRRKEVRLICVLYDVVGMELPFVTPAPAHLYHRHWVEIGHASERLVAISRFSAESYDRFIAKPNGIDVPIDFAALPNFLQQRAAEIGEVAIQGLEDRNFIVYCSTIEVRKNHILLLHLWEELRQRMTPEKLPILIFVGKWGWYADSVRLLAERNWRLRPHLRVLNDVSDPELIWLYKHARFTVFPSLTEGFGLAASESLSFGTPVIVSDCPALQEATEHLMPALHPHDYMGWLRELEHAIVDDAYLNTLRLAAARFTGPAYDAFAAKIRNAAVLPQASAEHPASMEMNAE